MEHCLYPKTMKNKVKRAVKKRATKVVKALKRC